MTQRHSRRRREKKVKPPTKKVEVGKVKVRDRFSGGRSEHEQKRQTERGKREKRKF